MTTVGGFTGALFGRLDGIHQPGATWGPAPSGTATGEDGPMGLGYGTKSRARQAAPASGLTVYSLGTFLGGNRADAPDMAGFSYEATAGTVGLEYSVNRNLIVGLAGNYATAGADVNSGATVDIDALQAAAYASYATRRWFADAVVALGHHDLDLARPGVTDTIRASTDATTIALAVRSAYLFDFGVVRAGPIAGLSYVYTRVGGYTEKGSPGDPTLSVQEQTHDAVTGSAGLRFLAPFTYEGRIVAPFLNVTLEHQFGDGVGTVAASLAEGGQLVLAPVANFDTRTYGKVEGGVTFELAPNASASVNAASTFARDEGNDYRVSAGFNYRF